MEPSTIENPVAGRPGHKLPNCSCCNQFSIASSAPALNLIGRCTNYSSLRIERKQLLGVRYAAQGVSTY